MTSLKCCIVEDHNEVVRHLYRAIGSKAIPFDGLTFVHFDSHPDMLSPKEIQAQDVFDKAILESKLSIENWILPILFAGHINRVVWVKCEWADQISDGTYTFQVGQHKETGQLRVTCPESYFVSELIYCHQNDLIQTTAKDVTLRVITVDSEAIDEPITGLPDLSGSPWVLDVDLDFFSTKNPFKEMYNPEQIGYLEKLYYCPSVQPGQEEEAARNREKQLLELKNLLHQVRDGVAGNVESESFEKETIDRLKMVKLLIESTDVDVDDLHEHGCTFDCSPLPHHISDPKTISNLIKRLQEALEPLPSPKLITVSRSSDDDYCPRDQVDSIQSQLLDALRVCYRPRTIEVVKDYTYDSTAIL